METARTSDERARETIPLGLLLAVVCAGEAAGQDEVEIGPVVVTAEEPDPPASPGMETVQSETVELAEEADTTWITLEDVLESTPSVRVRSYGAPGSPSFLSVRGTAATHTVVLLDGMPLNDASTGFVDLSTIPLVALESVTVVRGGHGSSGGPYHPGGVVLLSSRTPAPGTHGGLTLTLGLYPTAAGSGIGDDAGLEPRPAKDLFLFGAQRKLGLWQSWFGGSFGILVAGGLVSSLGDFAYYSDNGTAYNHDDDGYLTRANNEHTSMSGLVSATWLPDAMSQVVSSLLVHAMDDGLPGIDVLPTRQVGLKRSRLHLSTAYRRWSEDLLALPMVEGKAHLRLTSLEFTDPLGEMALSGADVVSRDLMAGLDVSLHLLRAGGLVLGATACFSFETWHSDNRKDPATAPVEARRIGVGLGADLSKTLVQDVLVLEASFRADVVHDGGTEGSASTMVFASPRTGIAITPLDWIALVGSVAYTHRPATFMELFGDGGVFRGNPDLEPESGVTVDAGLTVSLPEALHDDLSLSVSATWYLTWVQDLIVFIQNSQKTMVARNVTEARLQGVELGLLASWRDWASLRLGYTFQDPVDRSGIEPYSGLMLPNRARHDLYLEASVGHWGVEIVYLMDWMAGGYVDRIHQIPISERDIHTLEVRWKPGFAPGLSIDLKWWNVGNLVMDETPMGGTTWRRAIMDVDGYPLPGTAIFLTVGYRR